MNRQQKKVVFGTDELASYGDLDNIFQKVPNSYKSIIMFFLK
jgi:hypothetical protein